MLNEPRSEFMTGKIDEPQRQRIYFRLTQDEDGYPPTPWEGLWGKRINDNVFEIGNIPFYAMDVSPGDRVKTDFVNGRYEYRDTVLRSGNSVFRVYVYEESNIPLARDRLRRLGIQSELADGKMFAIEIPANADIIPVLDLLMEGQDKEEWDIEEGSLRHSIPD
jgi:Domain of unknown function (DUF4265)